MFYTFGIFMSLPVLTQYVYFRVSQFKGFPYNISETTEKGCNEDAGVNSSLKELEKEVPYFKISRCSITSKMAVRKAEPVVTVLVSHLKKWLLG